MPSLRPRFTAVFFAAALAVAPAFAGGEPITSAEFAGAQANEGSVTLQRKDTAWTLTLSADSVVPQPPAPHWQVMEALGNVFLPQRLVATDHTDQLARQTITVAPSVLDLAEAQISCAFAETLLGETTFPPAQL